tara:strand:+ start:301 stop:765 length:465 start_codon:yes stop_codon:yes gene_type:complete
MHLRQTNTKDKVDIKSIYFDSIISIDEKFYSPEQKFVWSCQAWENPEFDNVIVKGKGWVAEKNNAIQGFAIRYPKYKLSLLYCKRDAKRRGIGTMLLNKIEEDAKKDDLGFIKTDASLLSYKLLLKNKWKIIREEKIFIKNVIFVRYKMIKTLT